MILSNRAKSLLALALVKWGTYLARLAFPYKVGLPSAAAHVVGFLVKFSLQQIIVSRWHSHFTYIAADAHGIWMCLAARCALYFERIPERAFRCIGWQKLGHPVRVSAQLVEVYIEAFTDPAKSAVSVRDSIVVVVV
jgi:hypothetical protein